MKIILQYFIILHLYSNFLCVKQCEFFVNYSSGHFVCRCRLKGQVWRQNRISINQVFYKIPKTVNFHLPKNVSIMMLYKECKNIASLFCGQRNLKCYCC